MCYGNWWAVKLLLGNMLCENSNEINENSICSGLPIMAILPKDIV